MTQSPADLGTALAEQRVTARALDGRVSVTVDGQGRVRDVVLDPQVMKSPAQDIAAAVVAASREAQDRAAEGAADLVTQAAAAVPGQDALVRDLGEISRSAQGRLDEMTANLDAVLRRLP